MLITAAMIKNDVVTNVIVIENEIITDFENTLNENTDVNVSIIDVGDLPVTMNDTYIDGEFYRDGVLVESIKQEEIIIGESVAIDELTEAYQEGVNAVE